MSDHRAFVIIKKLTISAALFRNEEEKVADFANEGKNRATKAFHSNTTP